MELSMATLVHAAKAQGQQDGKNGSKQNNGDSLRKSEFKIQDALEMSPCKCSRTPCKHDEVCRQCNLPNRHKVHALTHTHYHEFQGKNQKRDHIPAADIVAMYRKKTTPRTGFMVLNPNNPFFPKWDVYMLGLLFYTASFTPYEVAFLEPTLGLQIVNRFVDIMFITDMFFNFFKAYYNPDTNKWVWDNWPICLHYLKGWFVLDFVSSFPLELIIVGPDPDSNDNASSLRLLRFLRLFRLFKLLRVVRASRIIQRWETVIDLRYSLLSLAGFILGILFLAHWGACLWGMIPQMENPPADGEEVKNWMVNYGVADASAGSKYLASLYWSFMTVTTIGYGDVPPTSDAERVVALMFMLLGAALYAYIVGSVCSVLNSLDQATNDFHMTMDHLNAYMQDVETPYLLRVKLREFFVHCQGQYTNTLYENVLDRMSPGLKGEFILEAHKSWVVGLTLFEKIPPFERDRFLTLLVLHFKLESYPPKEEIIKVGERPERFYVIYKGLVAMPGRVLMSGKAFGEDFVLRDTAFSRRFYAIRSLDYSDLYTLTQSDLHAILDSGEFPAAKRVLRVHAAKLLMIRWALAEAAKRIHHRKNRLALQEGEKPQPLSREGSTCAGYQILRMALDEERESEMGGIFGTKRTSLLSDNTSLLRSSSADDVLATDTIDNDRVPTRANSTTQLLDSISEEVDEKVAAEVEDIKLNVSDVAEDVSIADMYRAMVKFQNFNAAQFERIDKQMHVLAASSRKRSAGMAAMKVNRLR